VLIRLGLEEEISRLGVAPSHVSWLRWQDGRTLATMSLAEMESKFGAPYLAMYRRDLIDVLSAKVSNSRVRLGVAVSAVTESAGGPAEAATMIGPLINARQVAALEKGRRRGGRRRERTGAVALLMEFDDDQEAIDIANDTDFGLSGAVHTRDISRGVRIARRIHTGMIHVNDATHGDEPIVPYGGQKQSGIGRLNGQSSIDELTTLKWVSVNPGRRNYPYQ
jgi:hypothetical protein